MELAPWVLKDYETKPEFGQRYWIKRYIMLYFAQMIFNRVQWLSITVFDIPLPCMF